MEKRTYYSKEDGDEDITFLTLIEDLGYKEYWRLAEVANKCVEKGISNPAEFVGTLETSKGEEIEGIIIYIN